MSSLKHSCGAVVLSVVGIATSADAGGTPLCDQLAAYARTVPTTAWKNGGPWKESVLTFEQDLKNPTPFETQLVTLPAVDQAISPDGWRVGIQRLRGTDVYMLSTVQGTLHCQSSAFVQAKPGTIAKSIPDPMVWEGEGDMCWTVSGDFGRVFGQPAFIAHGSLNDHVDDEDIRVVPWTGAGWGKMCKVALRFRRTFSLVRTFCGDRGVCHAGEQVATDIAAAYSKLRSGRDAYPLTFRFGPPPPKAALDAAQRATQANGGDTSTPDFPSFGALGSADRVDFSYSGFTFFPLTLNGRWYVGAIGYDGVGWRESERTLLAIYSENEGALTPLASYEVDLLNGGLISARVENPNGPAN